MPSTTLAPGLRVSRLGLGAMVLTRSYATVDADESVATFELATDLGIDLIDTADSYAAGDNERFVAERLHIGTSGTVPDPSPGAPAALGFSLLQVGSVMASVNLMMSPVCRTFPGLRFVFSEGGIGWLPNALERADRMWLRHRAYNDFDDVLPSDIFRQNMYLCMIEEPVCLKYRHDIGVERIRWECDYPHTDTTWPDSQSSAAEVFAAAAVPADEVALISHGNAERVFDWKMAEAPAGAP